MIRQPLECTTVVGVLFQLRKELVQLYQDGFEIHFQAYCPPFSHTHGLLAHALPLHALPHTTVG